MKALGDLNEAVGDRNVEKESSIVSGILVTRLWYAEPISDIDSDIVGLRTPPFIVGLMGTAEFLEENSRLARESLVKV